MIIRAILILIFAFLIVITFFRKTTNYKQALVKIATVAFFFVSITAIVAPRLTDDVAIFVGVGRGADLMLYCLVIAFIINLLHQYKQNQEIQKKLETLIRRQSLYIAQAEHTNKKRSRKAKPKQ